MPTEINEYSLHRRRVKSREDYNKPLFVNCLLCTLRHTYRKFEEDGFHVAVASILTYLLMDAPWWWWTVALILLFSRLLSAVIGIVVLFAQAHGKLREHDEEDHVCHVLNSHLTDEDLYGPPVDPPKVTKNKTIH